jgi:hypothetical protein
MELCVTREEALQEYYFIQERIDALDDRTLRFKEWNITIASAAIGAAFVQEEAMISLLAVLSSLTFLLLECWWKEKQHIFERRASNLEKLLRDGHDVIDGPAISQNFVNYYDPSDSRDAYYKWGTWQVPIKRQWLPRRILYVSIFFLPSVISISAILSFLFLL